jgi:uncharacterized membrane protein YfcA
MLGIGGGFVLVPGLIAFLGMSRKEATAASLVAIVPIAACGVAIYALVGHQVRFDLGIVLAIGAVAGAWVGAAVARRLPERALQVAFGVVAIAVAIRLLLQPGAGV